MMLGSTPADAKATIFAIGSSPSSSAFDADITITTAAPSLIPEAFPAVTLPSFENAGLSLDRVSAVVPARGNSSLLKTIGSDLRCGISTEMISPANTSLFSAASASCWDLAANSSCIWREIENFSAMFSAVVPIW